MTSKLSPGSLNRVAVPSSPEIHPHVQAERREFAAAIAAEPNEFLTAQAIQRREKIQAYTCLLRPNPEIDESRLGFKPPALSFSVKDLEAYITPKCSSSPYLIGGAACHILGLLPFADVDLCYELPYLPVETLKEMIANFILIEMLSEPSLDLHAFIFRVAWPRIKGNTRAIISESLIKYLSEQARKVKPTLDFEAYLKTPFTDKTIEEALTAIKEREGINLAPFVLDFLQKAEFVDGATSDAITFQNLMYQYIESRYLYIQPKITNGLVLGLGGIDIKFIAKGMDSKIQRSYVALHDSLRVPYEGNKIYCASPSFSEAWKALVSRQFIVPSPENVTDLSFRTILAMTLGLQIPSGDRTGSKAIKQLRNSYPISSEADRKVMEADPLTLRYNRHLKGHYSHNGMGAIFNFLNFAIFLVQNIEKPDEQHTYFERIARGCQSDEPEFQTVRRLSAQLLSLSKQHPGMLPHLLSLIRGAFFCAWIQDDPGISAYQFSYLDDHGFKQERHAMHFGLTHDHWTEYLSIPDLTPSKLAEDFLFAWTQLETKIKHEAHCELTAIFATLGFKGLVFSADTKANITHEIIEACGKPKILDIIKSPLQIDVRHDRVHLLQNSQSSQINRLYEFIAKHMADCVDHTLFEPKLLQSRLARFSSELEFQKEAKVLSLVKAFSKVINKGFIADSEDIKEITRLMVPCTKDSEKQKIAKDAALRSVFARTLYLMICNLCKNAMQMPPKPMPNGIPNLITIAEKSGILSLHEKNIALVLFLEASACNTFGPELFSKKIVSPLDKLQVAKDMAESCSLELSKALLYACQNISKELPDTGLDELIYKCLLTIATSSHAAQLIPQIQDLYRRCLEQTLAQNNVPALRLAGALANELINLQQTEAFPKPQNCIIPLATKLLGIQANQAEGERPPEQYHQLGIQLLIGYGNAIPSMPQQVIQNIILERAELVFEAAAEKIQMLFEVFVKQIGSLHSFIKEYADLYTYLQNLVKDFEQKPPVAILVDFVQAIGKTHPQAAEKLTLSEGLLSKLKQGNGVEQSHLSIVYGYVTSQKNFEHAYEIWEKSQLQRNTVFFCSQQDLFELRMITAAKLLKHVVESSEKSREGKITKISEYLLRLIRENRESIDSLAKTSSDPVLAALYDLLTTLISSRPNQQQIQLAETIETQTQSLFSTLQLNQIALKIMQEYNKLEDNPCRKRSDHFLDCIFKKQGYSDIPDDHHSTIVRVTCDLAMRCLQMKQDTFTSIAMKAVEHLLNSKIKIEERDATEIQKLYLNIIKNLPRRGNRSLDEITETLISALFETGQLDKLSDENKINFLNALITAEQYDLFFEMWEKMQLEQPFSNDFLKIMCPRMCTKRLMPLIYATFENNGSMDRQSSITLLKSISESQDPTILTWLHADSIIRKALVPSDLPQASLLILKYISSLCQIAKSSQELHGYCEFAQSEWRMHKEKTVQEWPEICHYFLEILLQHKKPERLIQACKIFLESPCADPNKISYQILMNILNDFKIMEAIQHSLLPQVLKHISTFCPININSKETFEILETISGKIIDEHKIFYVSLFQIFLTCLKINVAEGESPAIPKFKPRPTTATVNVIQQIILKISPELFAKDASLVFTMEPIACEILDSMHKEKFAGILKLFLLKQFLILKKPALQMINMVHSATMSFDHATVGHSTRSLFEECALNAWQSAIKMLPIRMKYDPNTCDEVAEQASAALKSFPGLVGTINELVSLGDKLKWCLTIQRKVANIHGVASQARFILQYELIIAFCKNDSLEFMDKYASIIIGRLKELDSMVNEQVKVNVGAWNKCIEFEFKLIDALLEWNHTQALGWALTHIQPYAKFIYLSGPKFHIAMLPSLLKMEKRVIISLLSSPDFEQTEPYKLYFEYINDLANFVAKKGSSALLIQHLQKIIYNFLKHGGGLLGTLSLVKKVMGAKTESSPEEIHKLFADFTGNIDAAVEKIYNILRTSSETEPISGQADLSMKGTIRTLLLFFSTLNKEDLAYAMSKGPLRKLYLLTTKVLMSATTGALFNCPEALTQCYGTIADMYRSLSQKDTSIERPNEFHDIFLDPLNEAAAKLYAQWRKKLDTKTEDPPIGVPKKFSYPGSVDVIHTKKPDPSKGKAKRCYLITREKNEGDRKEATIAPQASPQAASDPTKDASS